MSPTRPVLRWHGGKWLLAPWIISHFPPHRIYVEPFGGAASVLLRKPRGYAEVYNDLDDQVVNLFRVLRGEASAALLRARLELTPFARTEFEMAWDTSDEPIEMARQLIIRSFMGFGSNAHSDMGRGAKTTGFRASSSRSGTTPARDWENYPDCMMAVVERLRGVIIEKRPAMTVMASHDGPDSLHYVDPPYLPETRNMGNRYDPKHKYQYELTVNDHVDLLRFLRGLSGFVVLSGYPALLYDELLPDWRRVERMALADGARERTEVLWINPRGAEAIASQENFLFPRVVPGMAVPA